MSTADEQPYPAVDKPDFPAIEARILRRWEEAETFQASVDGRPDDNEYVFYDGPPFANGLPHHGHLLTGYVKDVVPRYHAMRGKKVERRFGWDCHGLPAEMETEKQLGVSGRAAINEFGIDNFNEACRTSVLRYTEEWEQTVTRQARWVDFENDYKTMDLDYMESVIWAFKQLWDKGLVYEANRVMPYSWGAETPLSNFEIRLDDATRPRQDPAVTVAFSLTPNPSDPGPMKMLAWTTTPWTLPSNLALTVGPDLDYSIMELNGEYLILGSATVANYAKELDGAVEHSVVKGGDLVERTYAPLFPYFAARDDLNGFRVLPGDFVETDEGTGIVHTAPGFGEDDQRIGEENGMGMVVPVDDQGKFTDEVSDFVGRNVLEANSDIIRHLKDLGRLIKHETYEHNYPHCWRTDTPIIYRALPSWYVKVTDFRDRLVDLNQEINWIPDNVQNGRFGKWLEGARDWSISRNRFWGSPIPVWRSDNPEYPRIDVYGSLDELEADFGVRPTNLHRPYIDELVRPNPDDPTGESMMRRVPEVLDCWFESGSMPFAQVHYPFENKEWFEEHYPADFIVEYINQTRGWFYTLHVLAGALFDKPSFQNVICHGILLAEDGQKLSKKLRNYTEPSEIFDKQGADALRWYFMSSNIVRGGDARISDRGIDEVTRQVMLPVWNAYSFFTLYANIDGYRAQLRTDSTDELDRYILAKLRTVIEATTERMEAYDLAGATEQISSFLDALNNWYIRRSRDRFWGPENPADGLEGSAAERSDHVGGVGISAGSAEDKRAAYDTLYTVLVNFLKLAAPFLPMVTEEIYTSLTGDESVHLADWPDANDFPSNPDLVANMDRVRTVVSAALRLREDEGLRVRLPLHRLTLAGDHADSVTALSHLIADEVNVKNVSFSDDLGSFAEFALQPNGSVLGPRLGGDVQKVFGAAKKGAWTQNDDGSIDIAGHVLTEDEYTLNVKPAEGVTAAALPTNDAVVVLDTDVTPELEAEGVARDIVRAVQEARKQEDLVVTDRILLTLDLTEIGASAVRAMEGYVSEQTLATTIIYGSVDGGHDAAGVGSLAFVVADS
ncbi:MAG: isoleucine--tRNA ligase [Acidimicrobiia bacterium]|nr:isoleucine--tRNA ligase [Acidimicrobiia bacterium]